MRRNRVLRLAYRLLLASSGVVVCGCGLGIQEAGQSIERSAAELSKGLQAVAAADPTGLRKLVEENAALRGQLQALSARLNGTSLGTGVITLRNRVLQLQVAEYTGSFRLDAWVDAPINTIWQTKVLVP